MKASFFLEEQRGEKSIGEEMEEKDYEGGLVMTYCGLDVTYLFGRIAKDKLR
jgi:hypothetical protein